MKRIPDSVGERFITEDGRVFSNGKELKQGQTNGYRRCNIKMVDGWKFWFIHQLLLTTYVGPRPEGAVACHIDGNKENNHISNLKWGTQRDNMLDRRRHGTDKNKRRRFTNSEVETMRKRHSDGESIGHLAKVFTISQTAMKRIILRETYVT